MKIETKFANGDDVFYVEKGKIHKETIKTIDIEIDEDGMFLTTIITIKYNTCSGILLNEDTTPMGYTEEEAAEDCKTKMLDNFTK